MILRVPEINDSMDIVQAALAYAGSGWYVVPVAPDTKAPTPLGKGWQHKTMRDPKEIVAAFAGTNYELGLHVGRSGAVAFDLDEPTMVPEPLWDAISETEPPFQSSRDNVDHKGHYLFRVPEGRFIGNGRGDVLHPVHGKQWGEVRGASGIIVVQPSRHVKPHGRYEWITIGEVPDMPDYLARLLPDGTPSEDAVSDKAVQRFLEAYATGSNPALAKSCIDNLVRGMANGSRHEALLEALAWACRDIHAGLIDGPATIDAMRGLFLEAMRGESGRFPAEEFNGVLSWAVGQALSIDPDERREKVLGTLTTDDDWGGASEISSPKPMPTAAAAEALTKITYDSDDFWWFDGLLKRWDVEMIRLRNAVMEMGPLAQGLDHILWSYADGVWSEDQHVVRRRVQRLMGTRAKPVHWNNCESFILEDPRLLKLEGKPTEDYINFTNGMLEWKSGVLYPHDEKYLSTVQLPIAWITDATCPRFDAWLDEVLSEDYQRLVWQMLGYLLMSGNPLQVAFLFLGGGSNGKGTLLHVVSAMLGKENIANIDLDDLTGNRFAGARLYGRTANIAGDIDATFQEHTGKFKKVTGEDDIYAENKGITGFFFENWAVPLFSANKEFGSADVTHGYTRRWQIVRFERSFEGRERIVHFYKRFLPELSGVAAKAVVALRELMEDRWFYDGGEVKAGKDAFVENLDQVRQWISECTTPEPDGSESRSLLYKSYTWWATTNGVGKLSAKEFYHRLENAGYKFAKVNGDRRHKGLRIQDGLMHSQVGVLTDPLS
jgi:P4 family phage/plasmid primase-like protien